MTQATLISLDPAHGRAIVAPNYTGVDTTPAVIIQRTEDGGQTWIDVRGDLADGVVSMLSGSSRQFPDFEIPFDTPVRYRSIKSDLSGNPNGTTFNLSATVVLQSGTGCLWWVHPISDPKYVGGFMPAEDGGATLDADRGVQYGNSAVYPIVAAGPRQARSAATFTLIARTNSEQVDVLAAISPASVLCVRTPATHGWVRRFVVALKITETHPKPIQGGLWVYKIAYVEVARPTMAMPVYGATYDDLAAAYSTYAALQAGYGTYDDQTLAIL